MGRAGGAKSMTPEMTGMGFRTQLSSTVFMFMFMFVLFISA